MADKVAGKSFKITPISEIVGGKIDFQLKVRVINMWSTPDRSSATKQDNVQMILIDEKSLGLCNGTRLVITKMGRYVLEAKILTGRNIGDKVYIPRLSLTPSDKRIPFKFQRRQFPLVVSFAMTINKRQGQSLKHVGVYLPQSIFSHGQLYVAMSRVTSRKGLKILVTGDQGEDTNVVYHEVFQNVL